jgi:hypothetical protein
MRAFGSTIALASLVTLAARAADAPAKAPMDTIAFPVTAFAANPEGARHRQLHGPRQRGAVR